MAKQPPEKRPPKIDPTVVTVHRPRDASAPLSSGGSFVKKFLVGSLYAFTGIIAISGFHYSVLMTPAERAKYEKDAAADRAMEAAEEARRRAQEIERKAEEKRQEEERRVQEWFNGYGVRYSCEEQLKKQLRDPDSYQGNDDWREIPDRYGDKVLTWQFRSRNGFGGYNVAVGTCIASPKNGGTVKAEILEVP